MSTDPEVEKQLHAWSAQVERALPEVEIPTFQVDSHPVEKKHRHPWISFSGALALAASFMVLVSAAWIYIAPEPPEVAHSDLGDYAEVYSELKRMFPDHTIWFSPDESSAEIELSEFLSASEGERILVRVELQKRGEDGVWSSVWSRDVLTQEAEWVDSRTVADAEEGLRIWTHSPEPGVWWIETDVDLNQSLGLRVENRQLLRSENAMPATGVVELKDGVRLVNQLTPLPDLSEV